MLDKNKIRKFKESVLKGYKNMQRIPRYIDVEFKKETDGHFIQIGLRPLIDIDIFKKYLRIYIVPSLPELGEGIAVGEENYFINKILEKINKEEVSRSDLTKEKLIEFISELRGNMEDHVILTHIDFKFDVMLASRPEWIEYKPDGRQVLKNFEIPVYDICNDKLKNHIILINRKVGGWKYKLFNGEELDIKIGEPRNINKIDVTAKTLIKFDILNQRGIKVLKLID